MAASTTAHHPAGEDLRRFGLPVLLLVALQAPLIAQLGTAASLLSTAAALGVARLGLPPKEVGVILGVPAMAAPGTARHPILTLTLPEKEEVRYARRR